MAFVAKGLMASGPPPTKQMIESAEGDPVRKYSLQEDSHPGIRERTWGLDARTDTSVTFEEFVYWAKVEREIEREENRVFQEQQGPRTVKSTIMGRFSKGVHHENAKRAAAAKEGRGEKDPVVAGDAIGPDVPTSTVAVTDAEWRTAARALRTASWGGIFFLVTTDILGWTGCPFVFASVGYGPGIALYIVFGLAAAFSGFVIWRTFLGLDSSRFPVLSFGDPFLRIYGPSARHFINVTQSIQMFLSVAVVLFGQSQYLVQIINGSGSKNYICFTVVILIILVVSMILGNIRTLQRVGWLCNAAVWLNVTNFAIICYAAVHNPIDYAAVTQSTSLKLSPATRIVRTFAGIPPQEYQQQAVGFAATFNAVDNMVYAYSGAILFMAFLAEMRHPLDFWKGIFLAQFFICSVYIFFGVFVYSFFGQWSGSNIGQVITPYSLQTAGNVLTLITGFIAIVLYFNIGMKTVYLEVFQELLHFPSIATKKGKLLWTLLGPMYWILAFVFAAAVPNLNGIVDMVGGLFSLNFTYSIPAFMYVGYKVQLAAALPGEGFDPVTGNTVRHDGGMKRWVRGFTKAWYINIPVMLYGLCGLACSGMGTWAAIEGLIAQFGPGGTVATPFGCTPPV